MKVTRPANANLFLLRRTLLCGWSGSQQRVCHMHTHTASTMLSVRVPRSVSERHTRRRRAAPRPPCAGSTPPGGGDSVSRRLVDAVGAWLVAHPAPLWVVNNPLKRWVTTLTAGDYDREAASAELAQRIASDDVVVFSATYCPFSATVKRELTSRCIPFTAYEVNVLPTGKALVAELGVLIGRTSIPSVFIAGVSIGGCNDGTPGLRPLIASGGLPAALVKCSPGFRERRAELQRSGGCQADDA